MDEFIEIKSGYVEMGKVGDMSISTSSGRLFLRLASVEAYVIESGGNVTLHMQSGDKLPLNPEAAKEFLAQLPPGNARSS